MASRKATAVGREGVDTAAVLAAYARWLKRQPLAANHGLSSPRNGCWRVMRSRWRPKVPRAANRLGGDDGLDHASNAVPASPTPDRPARPYVCLISPWAKFQMVSVVTATLCFLLKWSTISFFSSSSVSAFPCQRQAWSASFQANW